MMEPNRHRNPDKTPTSGLSRRMKWLLGLLLSLCLLFGYLAFNSTDASPVSIPPGMTVDAEPVLDATIDQPPPSTLRIRELERKVEELSENLTKAEKLAEETGEQLEQLQSANELLKQSADEARLASENAFRDMDKALAEADRFRTLYEAVVRSGTTPRTIGSSDPGEPDAPGKKFMREWEQIIRRYYRANEDPSISYADLFTDEVSLGDHHGSEAVSADLDRYRETHSSSNEIQSLKLISPGNAAEASPSPLFEVEFIHRNGKISRRVVDQIRLRPVEGRFLIDRIEKISAVDEPPP